MFDYPPTPDHRPLVAPFQQKVYRVALPIGIPSSDVRVDDLDSLEQECT